MSVKVQQRELIAIKAVRNVLEESRRILERFQTAPDSTEFMKASKSWDEWREELIVAFVAKVSSKGGGHPDTMVNCRDDAIPEAKRKTNQLKRLMNRQFEFNDFGLLRIGLKQLIDRDQGVTATRVEKLLGELRCYGAGVSKSFAEFCKRQDAQDNLNGILRRLKDEISAIDFLLAEVSWLLGKPSKMTLQVKHRGNRQLSESPNPERRKMAVFYAHVRQHKQDAEGAKRLAKRLADMPDVLKAAKNAGITEITEDLVEAAIEAGRRLEAKQKPPTE